MQSLERGAESDSKMKCGYCLKKVPISKQQKDHFVPRSIISGSRVMLVDCCNRCNVIKSNYMFWSLESARDYIRKKIENPNLGYKKWLGDTFRNHVFRVEDLYLLSIIFERKVPDFSFFTNKVTVKK